MHLHWNANKVTHNRRALLVSGLSPTMDRILTSEAHPTTESQSRMASARRFTLLLPVLLVRLVVEPKLELGPAVLSFLADFLIGWLVVAVTEEAAAWVVAVVVVVVVAGREKTAGASSSSTWSLLASELSRSYTTLILYSSWICLFLFRIFDRAFFTDCTFIIPSLVD